MFPKLEHPALHLLKYSPEKYTRIVICTRLERQLFLLHLNGTMLSNCYMGPLNTQETLIDVKMLLKNFFKNSNFCNWSRSVSFVYGCNLQLVRWPRAIKWTQEAILKLNKKMLHPDPYQRMQTSEFNETYFDEISNLD